MAIPDWKVQELINLVQKRYPDWQNFEHPDFVQEELTYKRATIAKAKEWLAQDVLDDLLANGRFELIIERLDKLGRHNNLLWRVVPASGDTAVLYHPDLDTPEFCTQFRNLLYGDRASTRRLQTFSDYLRDNNLPNKWTFPTYYLFLCHPTTDIFVKPRTARWFTKFMQDNGSSSRGSTKVLITIEPSSGSYHTLLRDAQAVLEAMSAYGAKDMVDIQSLIWICAQESHVSTGRLDLRGQVELDIPPTSPTNSISYTVTPVETAVVKETAQTAQEKTESTQTTTYTRANCATETGYSESELQRWLNALQRKGQAIFYGPSGTGKTFVAQKLAKHLVSQGDGFQELVQFHPAYAYEDFIQGIRPFTDENGNLHYKMQYGRFLRLCQKAQTRTGPCVLVIDEINRANLASIFGELMYLLEYRQADIPLAGGGTLSIPRNVYIIGTMNTADRSIALVDHALRRRFAFIHMPPNMSILRHYHQKTGYDPEALINLLHQINNQIDDPHYALGITYFLTDDLPEQLSTIWQLEIEPYLEEYFFDRPEQANTFRWEKVKEVFIDY